MMRRVSLALLLLVATACAAQSAWVDRVVASVNGQPILWSDVDQEVRLQALMEARPLGEITIAQRADGLERLIDHLILEQQIEQIGPGAETGDANAAQSQQQRVAQQLADLRELHHAENDADWHRVLAEYGVTGSDVEQRLRLRVELLDFVDLRFRPGQQITQQQIAAYYRDTFVPQMQQRHAQPPRLEAVAPQIQRILLEQAVGQSLSDWLKVVRAQATVWKAQPFASMKPAPPADAATEPADTPTVPQE